MKRGILLLFLLLTYSLRAHESFFAFAELEYKELNGRLELTISLTCHDFEHYLQQKKIITGGLSKALKDSTVLQTISNELNNHFFIDFDPSGQNSTMDGVEFLRFTMDGYEEERTGTIRFYMHSRLNHNIAGTFGVTFDILMDAHSQQQNKLIFLYREKKSTFVFLQNNRKQLIDLN